MNLDEYQERCMRTAPRDPKTYHIPEGIHEALRDYVGDGDGTDHMVLLPLLKTHDQMVWTLGLAGEAGEFADLMKKHHGHGHDLDREKAAKELGDVMWYVAVLADSLGFNLDTIAQMNVEKLRKRYREGFTIAESKEDKLG